jgi:hypothetical protein
VPVAGMYSQGHRNCISLNFVALSEERRQPNEVESLP